MPGRLPVGAVDGSGTRAGERETSCQPLLSIAHSREREETTSMLDEELNERRKQLEAAINQTLSSSPQIAAAVGRIREKGYDVFLLIEAMIGLTQSDASNPQSRHSSKRITPTVRLQLTSHDKVFLKSLKIKPG
ncbi:MAG: hypothetical protein ACE5JX_00895 [Acidobacteriota bacterium]